jgi:hypothetical protein
VTLGTEPPSGGNLQGPPGLLNVSFMFLVDHGHVKDVFRFHVGTWEGSAKIRGEAGKERGIAPFAEPFVSCRTPLIRPPFSLECVPSRTPMDDTMTP